MLYAFCGFMMGYYWNIMWLDTVALLPLVILGLHHLLDEGKYKLYVIALAVAVLSNFYIGFFVCIFIAIYYFILYFEKYGWRNLSHFIQKLIEIVSYSFLSLASVSIVLLPIIYGMGRTYGQASGDPKTIETYQSIMDIFNNLLVNATPTIVEGLPNIYSGMLGLMFMLLYFMNRSISVRSRIFNAGLLLTLFFSLNINYLNFVWHGLHFPNQVPYRFSFFDKLLLFLQLHMRHSIQLRRWSRVK